MWASMTSRLSLNPRQSVVRHRSLSSFSAQCGCCTDQIICAVTGTFGLSIHACPFQLQEPGSHSINGTEPLRQVGGGSGSQWIWDVA